jgi:hypothetical protein
MKNLREDFENILEIKNNLNSDYIKLNISG